MAGLSTILNTPVLIHGIGSGVLQSVSGKVLELKTAQSMKLDVKATTEDQYGGDSLFPLYTFITKKEGTIEIQNADFKLSQLAIAQDSDYATDGNKQLMNFLITKDSKKLGDDADTFTGVEVVSIITPSGQKADANVFSISDAGAITVGEGATVEDGEYSVWVKVDNKEAVSAAMLKNAMPEVCSFNWQFRTEDADGNKYQVDIEARRVRADGEFALDTERDKASTPTLKVNILDPGNGHDDFAKITVSKIKK